MKLINNQADLEEVCKKLANETVIYVDTEFDRRRTYYAKLSLIQIASKSEQIIIDALSNIELTIVKDLLLNEKITKVFHAPDQDFEIFLHLFGKLPVNVFDTQIAASVAGMDSVMGYSRLCKSILNVNIDKTMQKANWLERPLAKELLIYAIKDVEYLIPLYRELYKIINERKLWDNYNSRISKLVDADNYKFDPDKLVRKMNLNRHSQDFKNKLVHLVLLREECAKLLNIPRNYSATDYELIELCENLPTNNQALSRLSASSKPISKRQFRDKLFNLCAGLIEN